jgi:hypothetical protein
MTILKKALAKIHKLWIMSVMRRNATSAKTAQPTVTNRGITADAAALGVHHTTLWRVLTGRAHNPALLTRYNDLVRLRSTPPNTTK